MHVMEAATLAERDALEAKSSLLLQLRHPGLVDLIESGPAPEGGWHLRTRWVGSAADGLFPSLSAPEVAGLGAALATIVGDLHALGWVHGNLRAEHILIDAEGRPVLCGLGSARRTVDPGSQAADARTLVEILECLLPAGASGGEWRRLRRALRPAVRHQHDVGTLGRRLASTRPQPRLFAPGPEDAGAPVGEDTCLPQHSPRGHSSRRHSRRPLARSHAAPRAWQLPESDRRRHLYTVRKPGLVGLAVLALGVGSLAVIGPNVDADRGPRCPAADGNCLPVAMPGGVLTTVAGRFAVGSPGDVVVLGRWDCGPVALPAVLRPGNGRVWAFYRWPTPGVDVAARPLGRVARAVSLSVVPGSRGCDGLKVLRQGMAPVMLHPAAPG